MKVILLQEIQSLGKPGEVKSVADGYARNFLIPKKLAEPATETALKNRTRKQAETSARLAREKTGFEEMAEKLRSLELRFSMKVGEKGQAFGSISVQDIADKLAEQGIKIEKGWIELEQGIKTTGEYSVKLTLPHQIELGVRVVVEPDRQ